MNRTFRARKTFIFLVLCISFAHAGFAQENTWQNQLEKLRNENVKESELHLDSYVYKGKIETENQRAAIINAYFSDEALIALTFENPYGYDIVSMRTRKRIARLENNEANLSQLKESLNQLIHTGYEMVEITWSYHHNTYRSLCIVSNQYGGIVYEPIGWFIIKEKTSIITNKTERHEKF